MLSNVIICYINDRYSSAVPKRIRETQVNLHVPNMYMSYLFGFLSDMHDCQVTSNMAVCM